MSPNLKTTREFSLLYFITFLILGSFFSSKRMEEFIIFLTKQASLPKLGLNLSVV